MAFFFIKRAKYRGPSLILLDLISRTVLGIVRRMKFFKTLTKDQNLWNIIYTFFFLVFVLLLSRTLFLKLGYLPTSISLPDFLLVVLATFRLIRLFVYDKITFFLRDLFADEEQGPGKTFFELLACPWCFGVWCSAVILFFYYYTPLSWYFILLLAIGGLASLLQLFSNAIGWTAEHTKKKATEEN